MKKVPTIALSLILPVYHEEKNITSAIENIESKITPSHEILVVYDDERDPTVEVTKRLIRKYPHIRLVKNAFGNGVIGAVRSGFSSSKADAVVVLSPDRSDEPETVNHMYALFKEGFDLVAASRYAKGGKRVEQHSLKKMLSEAAGRSTPFLLGIPITDLTNGFKLYSKAVIQAIPIQSRGGWEFAMELTIKAKRMGFRISEVPTISRKRIHGKSKFKLLQWLPNYLFWLRLGIKNRLLG